MKNVSSCSIVNLYLILKPVKLIHLNLFPRSRSQTQSLWNSLHRRVPAGKRIFKVFGKNSNEGKWHIKLKRVKTVMKANDILSSKDSSKWCEPVSFKYSAHASYISYILFQISNFKCNWHILLTYTYSPQYGNSWPLNVMGSDITFHKFPKILLLWTTS